MLYLAEERAEVRLYLAEERAEVRLYLAEERAEVRAPMVWVVLAEVRKAGPRRMVT